MQPWSGTVIARAAALQFLALVSRGAWSQTCSSAGYTSPQTVSNNATRLNQLLNYWANLDCVGTIVFANTGAPLTMRLRQQLTFNRKLVLDGSARSHPLILLPATGTNNRHFVFSGQAANLTAIDIVFSDGVTINAGGSASSVFVTSGAHLRLIRCTLQKLSDMDQLGQQKWWGPPHDRPGGDLLAGLHLPQ
jgi:hypothetical protein